MRRSRLLTITLALAWVGGAAPGCSSKDEPALAGGGVGTEVDDTGDSGGGGVDSEPQPVDSGGDSEGGGGEDTGADWPDPQDAGGPSQRAETCWFEDVPNVGQHVFCSAEVFDPDDNVSGGSTDLTIAGGDFGGGSSGEFPVYDIDQGCTDACLIDGSLQFAVPGVDFSESYTVTWTLSDASGNRGNEVEVEVTP